MAEQQDTSKNYPREALVFFTPVSIVCNLTFIMSVIYSEEQILFSHTDKRGNSFNSQCTEMLVKSCEQRS